MAQPTNFKEARNLPLGAGKNPNTSNMPVCIAVNPKMMESAPTMKFYVSKWKFEEYEKQRFLLAVFSKLLNKKIEPGQEIESILFNVSSEKLITILMEEYDHVWLSLMHTAVPSMVMAYDPFTEGSYQPINDDFKQN